MVDNVTTQSATLATVPSSTVIATDNIGGTNYQRVKVSVGDDGTAADVGPSNPLPISDNSGSLTVDNAGTFATQASQAGTWNVTNVSGTVSLPTGASTAAKQPALGTAGTASADVITVQGITSMTALKTDGSGVTQPVSGTVTANQGGTWTVQPGNTANTTAWKVDGSAVTQPISGSISQSGNWTARVVGNTGAVVDGVNTAATAPANGLLGLGIYNSTEPSPTTGQSVGVQLDSKGRQRQVIMDAAGNTRGANVDASNRLSVTVDNVSATNISSNVAQLAGTATDTNSGVKSAGTLRVVLATDQPALTNKLLVTPDSVALPANQSVNMAQVGGTNTISAGVAGAVAVGGTVATNTAITANPLNLGAQAVSSENSAVTTARQVQLVADLVGKLIVLPYANPENFVNGTTAAITDTTSTSTIAAQGAGVRTYITQVTVTNSHATVGTFVKILDGASIIFEAYAAAAGGGFTATFPTPLRGTANTAVNTQAVTTGANIISSVSGYKGA